MAKPLVEYLLPAINVLRSIHLEVSGHPDCPMKEASEKACDKLLELLHITNEGKK